MKGTSIKSVKHLPRNFRKKNYNLVKNDYYSTKNVYRYLKINI